MGSLQTFAPRRTIRDELSEMARQTTLSKATQLSSGIAIHDRDLRCIGWSGLCEQLSGLSKTSVLHSHGSLDTPLLLALGGRRALESALHGGTITIPDVLIRQPDRASRWIACTHTALYGVSGEIAGVTSHLYDISPQKSALSEMHGMLEQYQELYHNSPSGHHSFDANGVFTQMNNTELHWLGYKREEVMGHLRMSDVLTTESAVRFQQNLRNLREVGSIEEIEYDFVRKDGSTFPALLNGKARYGADGTFIGGRATVINITEHRRVETALRLSEANLKRSQTMAQCGNYQFATAAAEEAQSFHGSVELYRILGLNPEDGPIARHAYVEQFVHPEDRDWVRQAIFLALQEATGFELEYRIVRPDGSIRHVHDLGELIEKVDDQIGRFFGVIQDVTELRQAHEAVGKRERLFASLVENSFDGVALLQVNGRILYVTPGVVRILGFTPAELVGFCVLDYVHPDDVNQIKDWSRQLLSNPGGRVTDEFRFKTKNGGWLWVEVTNSNQQHNEAVGAIVCNFRDINQRKMRDAELLATNDQLLELSRHLRTSIERERTRMARELHDEIGSMLTAIKMYLGKSEPTPTSATAGPANYPRAIELLDATSVSLARIVTDLRPCVLDHRGLLPAIQWLATEFQERTGIECAYSTSVDVFVVEPDDKVRTAAFRICQEALTNISRHARASKASIAIKQSAAELVIEICDNGQGILHDHSADRPCWGIVGMRERAAELGGEVTIRSTPNEGTMVLLRLPWCHFASGATADEIS